MGKQEELVAQLRKELSSGKYAVGDLFPSGYELANRYGVSQPAVNIAVSHLVLEGLLERGVRGAGTRVRATRQFPKGWIAAVLSATHPLNAHILTSASARALASGYAVVHMPVSLEMLAETLDHIAQGNFIGVISTGYGMLNVGSKPIGYVNNEGEWTAPQPDAFFVENDSYAAACQMMQAVLGKGHRDVCVLASRNRWVPPRLKGFRNTMAAAGFPDTDRRIFYCSAMTPYAIGQGLRRLLNEFPMATAIVTAADDEAKLVFQTLQEQAPERLARLTITGFGNVAGIADMLPIATVDQHPETMGTVVVEHLIGMFEAPQKQKDELPRKIVEAELLNTRFIHRVH